MQRQKENSDRHILFIFILLNILTIEKGLPCHLTQRDTELWKNKVKLNWEINRTILQIE